MEPMRIVRVTVRDSLRLEAVEIQLTPDDEIVIIGGDNDQGKSSVLDCIMAVLYRLDPLEFLRWDGKRQVASLMQIAGLDFAAMDADRATTYAERTRVNGEVATATATLDGMPTHADVEPIDVAQQVAELERQHNRRIDHEDTRQFPVIYDRLDDLERRIGGDGSEVPPDYDPCSLATDEEIDLGKRINWLLADARARRGQ